MGVYIASLRGIAGDAAADRALADPAARLSFSQHGEDAAVVKILTERASGRGIYVDLGCHHPTRFSNTHLLHLMGWRGVNVDANPASVRLFNRQRPGDVNICSGVAERGGVMVFRRYEGADAVATFSDEEAARKGAKYREASAEPTRVRSFDEIMDIARWDGARIDLLNIDLEGFDARVLRSIDLDRYRPLVVCAELVTSPVAPVPDADVAHMRARGYLLHSKTGMSAIFCRAELFAD